MKNSIESIWKEGFLNEKSLVAPKINDLYNQKSRHVVEKMKRTFRKNIIINIILAVVIPFGYYLVDAIWQGIAASLLILLIAWAGKTEMNKLQTLNQGTTSLEYLKSCDRWLKDAFSRSKKLARWYYTLCLLIGLSTMGSAWNKQEATILRVRAKYPDLLYVGNIPLIAWIFAGIATLLMFYFSDKIYRWDVRLMYGPVFDKLDETIKEMEKLKQE